MKYFILLGICSIVLSSCAGVKVIVKNCDKASNAELWICEKI